MLATRSLGAWARGLFRLFGRQRLGRHFPGDFDDGRLGFRRLERPGRSADPRHALKSGPRVSIWRGWPAFAA